MRGSKRRPSRSQSWSPRTSPQRLLQLNIPSSGVHALQSGCTTPNTRSLSLLNRCNRPPCTPPLVSLYPLILVSLYANDRILQTKNGRMTGRPELKRLLHHHLLLGDRRAASLPRGVGRVMSKALCHLRKKMWMLCMSSQSGGREVERASVRLLGNVIICHHCSPLLCSLAHLVLVTITQFFPLSLVFLICNLVDHLPSFTSHLLHSNLKLLICFRQPSQHVPSCPPERL